MLRPGVSRACHAVSHRFPPAPVVRARLVGPAGPTPALHTRANPLLRPASRAAHGGPAASEPCRVSGARSPVGVARLHGLRAGGRAGCASLTRTAASRATPALAHGQPGGVRRAAAGVVRCASSVPGGADGGRGGSSEQGGTRGHGSARPSVRGSGVKRPGRGGRGRGNARNARTPPGGRSATRGEDGASAASPVHGGSKPAASRGTSAAAGSAAGARAHRPHTGKRAGSSGRGGGASTGAARVGPHAGGKGVAGGNDGGGTRGARRRGQRPSGAGKGPDAPRRAAARGHGGNSHRRKPAGVAAGSASGTGSGVAGEAASGGKVRRAGGRRQAPAAVPSAGEAGRSQDASGSGTTAAQGSERASKGRTPPPQQQGASVQASTTGDTGAVGGATGSQRAKAPVPPPPDAVSEPVTKQAPGADAGAAPTDARQARLALLAARVAPRTEGKAPSQMFMSGRRAQAAAGEATNKGDTRTTAGPVPPVNVEPTQLLYACKRPTKHMVAQLNRARDKAAHATQLIQRLLDTSGRDAAVSNVGEAERLELLAGAPVALAPDALGLTPIQATVLGSALAALPVRGVTASVAAVEAIVDVANFARASGLTQLKHRAAADGGDVSGRAKGMSRADFLMDQCLVAARLCGANRVVLALYDAATADGTLPQRRWLANVTTVCQQLGYGVLAYHYLMRLRHTGVVPTERACNSVIRACARQGRWFEAMYVFRAMRTGGGLTNAAADREPPRHERAAAGASVADEDDNSKDRAEPSTTASSEEHDTDSGSEADVDASDAEWTGGDDPGSGHRVARQPRQARRSRLHVDITQRWPRPSEYTYHAMVHACLDVGKVGAAVEALEHAIEDGCATPTVYAEVVEACANAGDLEAAKRLLARRPPTMRPDGLSWRSKSLPDAELRVHAVDGNVPAALASLESRYDTGGPAPEHFGQVFRAMASAITAVGRGSTDVSELRELLGDVLQRMRDDGVEPLPWVYHPAIEVAVKVSEPALAVELLREVSASPTGPPRSASWHLAMASFLEFRDPKAALEVFLEARRSGSALHERVYSLAMAAAGDLDTSELEEPGMQPAPAGTYHGTSQGSDLDLKDPTLPLLLLEEAMYLGIDRSPRPFNEALHACVKRGELDAALSVLDIMNVRGLAPSKRSLTIVATACASDPAYARKAASVMEQLISSGHDPAAETYSAVVAACARAAGDQLPRALDMLEDMREAGLYVSEDAFEACIAACATEGDSARAWQLLAAMKDAGFVPRAALYAGVGWKRAQHTVDGLFRNLFGGRKT